MPIDSNKLGQEKNKFLIALSLIDGSKILKV